jgi:hypothetical protein
MLSVIMRVMAASDQTSMQSSNHGGQFHYHPFFLKILSSEGSTGFSYPHLGHLSLPQFLDIMHPRQARTPSDSRYSIPHNWHFTASPPGDEGLS